MCIRDRNESNAISSEVEQFADEQTNVEETTEELETQRCV